MKVIIDGLSACSDCTIAIANGDFSGMDDAIEAKVKAGIERLSTEGYLVIGDEIGFTWQGCDCCLDGLGGDKHELVVLG